MGGGKVVVGVLSVRAPSSERRPDQARSHRLYVVQLSCDRHQPCGSGLARESNLSGDLIQIVMPRFLQAQHRNQTQHRRPGYITADKA
ncbi:hypothetical protein D3C73_793160 [compost metagenome]